MTPEPSAATLFHDLPDLPDGSTLTFTILGLSGDRPQGLRLQCLDGLLEIRDQRLADLVLAPQAVGRSMRLVVHAQAGAAAATVRIWHAWQGGVAAPAAKGVVGMVVDRVSDGELVLRCSDGQGEPGFGDLVARVEIGHPTARET